MLKISEKCKKLKGEALRKRVLAVTEKRIKQLKEITKEKPSTLKDKEE
jgi:hypothetical protein